MQNRERVTEKEVCSTLNDSLIVAAKEGHVEFVKQLIAAGADSNEKNNNGVTALRSY